ncbi:efflux RND transporter periplasmic adaptor subunit [Candidatus Poribacteria bacterium]|nr:efflux RND transporter periplasmic adaptor subunit [Candidatus Poribacteria bacterium]
MTSGEQAPRPSRDEQLRSLSIDAVRRMPSRSMGAPLFFGLGVVLGLGLAIGLYYALNRGKGDINQMRAAAVNPASLAAAEDAASPPAASPKSAPTRLPAPGTTLLTASGYVTPRHRVSLSPKVTGIVSWVGVEKGDGVKKGDVLVRLDDEDYAARVQSAESRSAAAKARLAELEAGTRPEELRQTRARVAEAKAALENAESRLHRAESLVSTAAESAQTVEDAAMNRDMARARLDHAQETLALLEAGPRAEQLDAARAELAAAEADLSFARIQLKDTIITAPIDGTILEKLIEPGELVSPQNYGGSRGARTELLSMADLSDLQVEVDINESDFAKVRHGQPARVTLDAYPEDSYDARIREVAPEADRTKATIQIKVQITNPDHLVRPEMGARVDLLAGEAGGGT